MILVQSARSSADQSIGLRSQGSWVRIPPGAPTPIPMLKRIALVLLLCLPFAAWAFVKQVRTLAPELAGVHCYGRICTDEASRLPEATRLFEEAVTYVQGNVAPIEELPRAIFCATPECSRSFGFSS